MTEMSVRVHSEDCIVSFDDYWITFRREYCGGVMVVTERSRGKRHHQGGYVSIPPKLLEEAGERALQELQPRVSQMPQSHLFESLQALAQRFHRSQ